jgi:hypothetical protein
MMRYFVNPADGVYWAFDEAECDISGDPGALKFRDVLGNLLSVPEGLEEVAEPPQSAPSELDMSLDAVKLRQHAAISAAFASAAETLTAGYPEAERLTWPTQQSEALAWEANNSTATPYLDSIAAARGIDVRQMRTLTLDQVHAFQTASAQLVGTRQKLRDQIDAATTVSDVQAITWPA